MTDKQIIIDGVDVSGCEYFSSGLGYCTIGLLADDGTHICECEQNCYYKQLKRKEQEYEKAKKIIETAVDDFNLEYGTPQYDRLLNGAKSLGIEVKDYE